MAKRIIITGSSGFMGKYFHKFFSKKGYETIGLSISEAETTQHIVDLCDKEKTLLLIKNLNPDIIIHCAALSNVEYCEENHEETESNNILATSNICEAVPEKCKMIYISTDYVYDGVAGNFDEASAVNPINYYGLTKLKSEQQVMRLPNYLILRTTVAFGYDPGGKNFFMQLLDSQKNKRIIRVPADQISNPTYIDVLLETTYNAIEKDISGIFLLTGPESISRYDFAAMIADEFGFEKKLIMKVSTHELGQKARRPLNCSTSSAKIQAILGVKFPSLSDSIKQLHEAYKNDSQYS